MIDKTALYSLSNGVYLFTMKDGDRYIGRAIDAVTQVSSNPKIISISLAKTGYTVNFAIKGACFAMTTLAADAPMNVIEAFGYQSSETVDKFVGFSVETDEAGVPYVTDGALAEISCVIDDVFEIGDHMLLIASVTEAHTFSSAEPMTYAHFRTLKAAAKKPATDANTGANATQASAPADSPSQAMSGKTAWRCMICGYVIEMDELPDDFVCPMCGMGKEMFERITL